MTRRALTVGSKGASEILRRSQRIVSYWGRTGRLPFVLKRLTPKFRLVEVLAFRAALAAATQMGLTVFSRGGATSVQLAHPGRPTRLVDKLAELEPTKLPKPTRLSDRERIDTRFLQTVDRRVQRST